MCVCVEMGALRRHVCGMNVVVIMAGMWLIPIIVSHGAINREVLADVTAINTLGPYLGIVVPNLFELQPLLDMDSFTQDTSSNHSTIVISGTHSLTHSLTHSHNQNRSTSLC